MSVMLYPCMLCVAMLMWLFVLCVAWLTVFVNYKPTLVTHADLQQRVVDSRITSQRL